MAEDEAKKLGVSDEDRRFLIRLDPGKVNIAPPATGAKWFRLVGVPLDNSSKTYPNGDTVQTVECWKPPGPFDGVDRSVIDDILDEIDKGLPDGTFYSDHNRARERAAWRVIQEHLPERTEEQCRLMVQDWLRRGALKTVAYRDKRRRQEAKGLRRG